jgi:hypothetical protein
MRAKAIINGICRKGRQSKLEVPQLAGQGKPMRFAWQKRSSQSAALRGIKDGAF